MVGTIVLFATTMVTAYMDSPAGGRPAAMASALCRLGLEAAYVALGITY